ncbi:ATP-grasp domain-containing protein [Streptacidiphilus sp. PB12-B1b]|uniref:carboxylate--amine ligase n=1 Tax=Streptacidiphilus sp. PB12-B1b TaxID=2705012 RepID=UPI001CDB5C31|nr:ATP-grasp domain-containing protein [Streptacidiphilus sp. PB12-B1b]
MDTGLDRDTPVLVVKIGHYPLHHGGVGAIRSLGRAGVPVYAVAEDRYTPAALSRFLRGRFVWPTTGAEPAADLVDGLARIGRRILEREGRRCIALPTDDEAAVLLAEHAEELAPYLLMPRVEAGLPRALAGKQSLHRLCLEHGVATPRSARPATREELEAAAAQLVFPIVAKNADPYARLSDPAVGSTTVLADRAALDRLAAGWTGPALPRVLLQEYLPVEHSEDWIAHLYCGDRAREDAAELVFTGVKVRAWPPRGGVTAHAYTTANPELARESARFCRAVGFHGICDLDWRFDRRDGRYKLLDFNPRLGAQFRLFETGPGIDLVRAMHLDLTGRSLPEGGQLEGRRFTVEILDGPARIAARRGQRSAQLPEPPKAAPESAPEYAPGSLPGDAPAGGAAQGRGRLRELAWSAADDPLPALSAVVRSAGPAVHRLRGAAGSLRGAARRGPRRGTGHTPSG